MDNALHASSILSMMKSICIFPSRDTVICGNNNYTDDTSPGIGNPASLNDYTLPVAVHVVHAEVIAKLRVLVY